jgi:hypothetical protein
VQTVKLPVAAQDFSPFLVFFSTTWLELLAGAGRRLWRRLFACVVQMAMADEGEGMGKDKRKALLGVFVLGRGEPTPLVVPGENSRIVVEGMIFYF